MFPEFKTYENENDFSELKQFFDAAELEVDLSKKLKIIKNIKVHSASDHFNVGLFGQRLADFNNGLEFKKLVNDNYPNIDGYVWSEFGVNNGLSYCLFDSCKLSSKITEEIEIVWQVRRPVQASSL